MKNEKIISIWSKALIAAQENKSEQERRKIMENLSVVLKKQKKEQLLPEILKKSVNFLQREKGVTLFLARDHNPETIAGIKNKLLALLGNDKEINVEVDKDLVGGFRARSGKFLMKASIKDFLNELKANY